MSINPNTGIEEVKPVINTDVMKQYNQNYNPNVWVGSSWIIGTSEKPTITASITPAQVNIGGTNPNIPQQQQPQAETNLNIPPPPVSTPQATSVPVDSGNILSVRANQTPEEKVWQAKQDAFDQARTWVNLAPAVMSPTQVEKTTTTTPQGETVVKKETPATNFNVWAWREQEILKNLNEGFVNAPDLFQNQDTFRASYGYATADETKKRMLDAFFQAKNSQQNNPDALFQQIATNQPIYNQEIKKTPAYQKAFSRFNDLNINAGLSTNELADKIKNGSITIGSQAYTDLQAKNPALLQKAEMLNSINTGRGNEKIDSNTILSNVSENVVKDMSKNDIPNYQKMLAGDTKVVDARDKWMETKTKRDALQDSYDNLEEDIRAQYKGKDVTEGYIQALIAEKGRPIARQLNTLARQESNQLANLQYYSDIVKEDYNSQKEAQKTASDRAYESTKDTREFEQQKQLAQFQQELGLKGKQAEFDQKVKQQAALASDPYTAISTVMDEYQKIGVPFTQSLQTKLADAQKFIAGGGTIGQYVDKMLKDIQSKPEYQSILQQKLTWKPATPNWKQDASGNWYDENSKTSPAQQIWWTTTFTGMDTDLRNSEYVKQYPNEASFKNNNPAGITWNANFDNGTGIAKALKDAGINFSKGTARPSSEGGNYVQFDTIWDGMKARQVIFTATYWNKDLNSALQSWKWAWTAQEKQQYADSIMKEAGINPNQSITYNNLSQEQKDALTLTQIKRESAGLYKVLTSKPQTQWPVEYSDTQKNIMQWMDAKNISAQDAKILQQNKLTASDVYNYKASLKANKWSQGLDDVEYKRVNNVIDDLASDQVTKTFKKSQEAYNFASKVQSWNTATDNQALIYAFAKAMDPDSVVREGEYSTVQKYSQTWGDQFGMNINRILNGQEFISDTAKKNMVNTIKSKYNASKDAYENLRKTKIKMINDIAGKDIWDKAIPSDVMEIQSSSEAPKKDYFSDAEANSLDYNKYF